MKVKTRACLLAAVLFVAGAALLLLRLRDDPGIVFLTDSGRAGWVRVPAPMELFARFDQPTTAVFSTTFDAPMSFLGAPLSVTALRQVSVEVDGRLLLDDRDLLHWKTARGVQIPALAAGPHRLVIRVRNPTGPSLVRADCAAVGIATGSGRESSSWDGSADGGPPVPVVRADAAWEPGVPAEFGRTLRSLAVCSPLLAVPLAAGMLLSRRRAFPADWASRPRGLLLVAWVVLAADDVFKVPLTFGYDVQAHYAYIDFIASHGRLPPGDGGWQFFQSPLYYLISAGLQRLLTGSGAGAETVQRLLRVIPLACGASMVEICYRAGRLVFPTRNDLAAVVTGVGGLLPMNLYMAQSVSNEPMAAVLCGIVLLMCLKLITDPARLRSPAFLCRLGFVLGFAWLTKVSTLVWGVPVGIAVAVSAGRSGLRWPGTARAGLVILGSAGVCGGWFFVKNQVQLGRPFLTESTLAGKTWWQDPGYRTPRMLYEFGAVFDRTVFNGTQSVGDSLYGTLWGDGIPVGAPSWNYGLVAASLWLGIVPTLMMMAGALRGWVRPGTTAVAVRLSAVTVVFYLAAVVLVFLRLPIYSCAKASYLLASTPCLAILAAAGFQALDGLPKTRSAVVGLLLAGGAAAYMGYFVV
jgi:hypothetical protein